MPPGSRDPVSERSVAVGPRDSTISRRRAACNLGRVALGLLAVLSLAWGSYHALTTSADLMRRVDEVNLVLQGRDPYQDPDMTYPPSAPAVFVPLIAPLVHHGAALRGVWLALNLAAMAVIVHALRCQSGVRWSRDGIGLFAATVAAAKCVRLTIGMGQFAMIPLALVLSAFRQAGRRQAILAGLGLGASLVKPTMTLPFLVVFAVRGRWRTLAVAAIVQAVAMGTLAGWLGTSPTILVREWLDLAASQRAAGLIDLPSVVARFAPEMVPHATVLSLGVLALGSLWMIAHRGATDRTLLAFAGYVAAVMAYHRPYDLVLLVPTLAVLMDRARDGGRLARAATILFATLLVAPAHPAVIDERLYDALFIPASYGYLGFLSVLAAVESRAARSASRAPDEPITADGASRTPVGCSGSGHPALSHLA